MRDVIALSTTEYDPHIAPPSQATASVDERDASRHIGFSPSWMRQARMRRSGPPFVKVGRTIRYRVADLEAWLLAHRVETRDIG